MGFLVAFAPLLFKVAESVLGGGTGPLKMKWVAGASRLLLEMLGQKAPEADKFMDELEDLLRKTKDRDDWEEASILKIGDKTYRIKILKEIKP